MSVAIVITDAQIEALAHRRAWRYKKSSDPHHSDTYTFNRATLLEFVREAAVLSNGGAVAPQAPAPTKITEAMHVAAVRAMLVSTGNDDFPQRVWNAMHAAQIAAPVVNQRMTGDAPAMPRSLDVPWLCGLCHSSNHAHEAGCPNAVRVARQPADHIAGAIKMAAPAGVSTTDAEAALVKAAMAWWEGHRPVRWSQEQHRAQPAVNCNVGGAQDLAHACAALISTTGLAEGGAS